jgi:hypothetical protein
MRARQLEHGPEPLEDEPPTGLLDLAAIRAAVAAGPPTGELDVDPAAAAWLAGGPDPAAARVVEQVDQLERRSPDPRPEPVCSSPSPSDADVPATSSTRLLARRARRARGCRSSRWAPPEPHVELRSPADVGGARGRDPADPADVGPVPVPARVQF